MVVGEGAHSTNRGGGPLWEIHAPGYVICSRIAHHLNQPVSEGPVSKVTGWAEAGKRNGRNLFVVAGNLLSSLER